MSNTARLKPQRRHARPLNESARRTTLLRDPDAERALVGYLLSRPDVAKAPPVTKEHLTDVDLQRIFEFVVASAQKQESVDVAVLTAHLQTHRVQDAETVVAEVSEAAGVDCIELIRVLDECLLRRQLDTLSRTSQRIAREPCEQLHDEIHALGKYFAALSNPTVTATLNLVDDVAIVSEPDLEYLVHGVVPASSVSLLIGPSGCGKTFLALDLAFSVASGRSWHTRPVKRGPVVYIAAEGQPGLSRRVEAWKRHYGLHGERLGVSFLRQPIDLLDIAQIAALNGHLRLLPEPPVLVVVDTWSVALAVGAGDENVARDVNRALANLRGLVQDLRVSILLVHHEGHGAPGRARGSSALRAGVDAELTVSAHTRDVLIVKNSKQRDQAQAAAIALRRCLVELPNGQTSCVLEGARLAERTSQQFSLDRQDVVLLQALAAADSPLTNRAWRRTGEAPWKAEFGKRLAESTFERVRLRLVAQQYVENETRAYTVTLKGRQHLHFHQNAGGGGSGSDHQLPPPPSPPSSQGEGDGGRGDGTTGAGQ